MKQLVPFTQSILVVSTIGVAAFWPSSGEPVALLPTGFANPKAALEWADHNDASLLSYDPTQNVWVAMARSEESLKSALRYGLVPMSARPVLCNSQTPERIAND
ncbi:MAG: hypothetical protein AAGL10_07805 [Pseudomonadota bacterium]